MKDTHPDYSWTTEHKMFQGRRLTIPVHYDLWMRGARHGVIEGVRKRDLAWRVKMDNPLVKRRVYIPLADKDFCKVEGRS